MEIELSRQDMTEICRLCLTVKKDMRNLFTESIIAMLEELVSTIKVTKVAGWPDKICIQCVHQVSRCHAFKKKIEKSDEQLKQYIKSLTVIIEEPVKETPQIKAPHVQEIQIQRPEPQHIQQATPLIIANLNPTVLNGQHQLIQTANGQIIGQFLQQGPNNTFQMITTPAPQPQLLQIRPEHDNRLTELITVQPTTNEINEPHHQYYEEIPIVVQSANGQQTILNLPHHQVQALQQQQQQHQQQQMQQVTTTSSETDEIEIHEVQSYEDEEYICEDMEEIVEEEMMEQEVETAGETTSYYVQKIEEINEIEQEDNIDKQLLAEFFVQHTVQEGPSKFICNLCHTEFKKTHFLESHMKTVHINWIKANCKKQPQCEICQKQFRGPGMLKMHMKTHERENKMPTCSICSKEFKSKSILYRHRATHFADQKQYLCTICNKSFNSNYQLNSHAARHQKNHQCTECDKCFSNANEKKIHMQQEHPGGSIQKKITIVGKSS